MKKIDCKGVGDNNGFFEMTPKVGGSELDDLLFAGTTAKQDNEPFTMDKLEEVKSIIEALTPPKAPEGVNVIQGVTGLTIMKNNLMPSGTIMVSEDLFDLIYASSK